MGNNLKLPILVYHRIISNEISIKDIPAVIRPYCLPGGRFAEHLDYLLNRGCKGISVSEVFGQKEFRVVGITFDDGWESDYIKAFPELEKRGFRATFYIVTGYVGRKNYMDWVQIKELKRKGMEIGSHSVTHPCLLDLDKDTILQEITQSKQVLEDHLGEPVESFGVPYAFVNRRIIETALKVGYETVCISNTWLADTAAVPKIYGRYGMRRGDSIETFKGIVERRPFELFKIAIKEEGKKCLKRLMGRQVWLAFREKLLSRRNS